MSSTHSVSNETPLGGNLDAYDISVGTKLHSNLTEGSQPDKTFLFVSKEQEDVAQN